MIFKNFLYGIIIGIGFIIPGVSGGVLATILGIYDPIIFKINHFFINTKDNFYYLFPIFTGFIISILIFSKIILHLLNNNLILISYIFIGLIIGSIPFLLTKIKLETNKSIKYLPFFLSLLLGIFLFFISKNWSNYDGNNSVIMIIAGIFYAAGKIIPGISGSSLLMILGVYNYFLNIIANPLNINLIILKNLIPFFISFLISAYFLLKLIEYLLNNYFQTTYSIIIGFIISSCLFIYPNYFSIIYLFISILSFIISYTLSKK